MNLVGLMPVRNEDWILGLSARAALMWCDSLVILNHDSSDETGTICARLLAEFGPRVVVLTETNAVWEEMRHRQRLLDIAREVGATHIAMVDADEVLTGNLLLTIRGEIEKCPPRKIFQLPWLCIRDGVDNVIVSGIWSKSEVSTAFRDDAAYHWKTRDGYDFHHRHPLGNDNGNSEEVIPYRFMAGRSAGLMHLQFASRRRLVAKHYAYQLTERLRWPDRKTPQEINDMYSNTVTQSERAFTQHVPPDWWSPYASIMCHMEVDKEPWQIDYCRRIIAAHPGIETGLNNFGINL